MCIVVHFSDFDGLACGSLRMSADMTTTSLELLLDLICIFIYIYTYMYISIAISVYKYDLEVFLRYHLIL